MKTRKKILRRLTILYVLFFAIIAVSIVLSFDSAAFGEGFRTGVNDANRVWDENRSGQRVDIFYDLRAATGNMDFNMPVFRSQDGSVTVSARPSKIDVEAVSEGASHFPGSSLGLVFGVFSILTYGAIFVIIFLILHSLRKSIRTEDVFERSNIVLTRLIGILLIAGSLLFSLASWIEGRAVAPYFEGSGYALNTSFPFSFSELIMGVLIFFVAEVFAIGSRLSEEQKLTI